MHLSQKSNVSGLPVWVENSLLYLEHVKVPQSIFKMFRKNICKVLAVQVKPLKIRTIISTPWSAGGLESWYISHLVNRGHMPLFQVRYQFLNFLLVVMFIIQFVTWASIKLNPAGLPIHVFDVSRTYIFAHKILILF